MRRWLLDLCAEGQAVATGTNKGRRYQATTQEAVPATPDTTLESLQQDLVREVVRDGVRGHTLNLLLTERVRALLPAPARARFIDSTLENIRSLTQPEAEALGISPEMFKYWHDLQHTGPHHGKTEA